MRAIIVDGAGGPEQMRWGDVATPEAGPGQVRIRVAASAVNRADTLQRLGRYRVPEGVTPILGLECSGTIDQVGEGVTGWSVGDAVCALLDGGGYAEAVVVAAAQVLPVPAGVSVRDAAALPEVACTVWSNLVMVGGLRAGDDVLVHGGGSGIGTFATQLIAALGARPLVTAGSAEKLGRCAELGAAVGIDYRQQDFVAESRAATQGRGVDMILDNMGGAYLTRNLEALADDGRLICIGLQGGSTAELDMRPMLHRRLSLHVTTLRSRPPAQKAEVVAQVRDQLWPMVASGCIEPVIDRTFPMSAAADAHRLLERSGHVGKVLLNLEQEAGHG